MLLQMLTGSSVFDLMQGSTAVALFPPPPSHSDRKRRPDQRGAGGKVLRRPTEGWPADRMLMIVIRAGLGAGGDRGGQKIAPSDGDPS